MRVKEEATHKTRDNFLLLSFFSPSFFPIFFHFFSIFFPLFGRLLVGWILSFIFVLEGFWGVSHFSSSPKCLLPSSRNACFFFFEKKKTRFCAFPKVSPYNTFTYARARAPLFALREDDDDDKNMNFEDLEDDILDELGPIERWDVSAPEHNLGGRPTMMMMQRERKKSHCRERFGLDDPRNAEEAMRTSQALVTKAVMETMEMKGDLEKRKRGAIVPIPEEKWPGIEKAASQFEADVMTNSRERGIGKYIDLSATGMRLKYARFGDERNDRTVFILHDTGENGECYYGLAKQVQEKGGFTVYCVDFRGHGDSTYSREGQYNVPSFVADIESFIIELDLYAHPVALVGFGLGAIVAAAFAGEHEHLVAGVTLIESHPRCREDAVAFHRFQSVSFGSLREAVTFEIATIWPDNERRNAKQCAKRMLSKFRKPKSDEVTGVMKLFSQNMATYEFRIDSKFLFEVPSIEEYFKILEKVKCHASVYRGEHSSFMDEKDLEDVLAALRRYGDDKKRKKIVRGKSIPDASHYVFEDQPATLRDYILHSLLISEPAMTVENNASRTPEFLNLKPLPKYATVEDAIKALKPRKIPTDLDVERVLKKCKEEWDECDSESEDEEVKMRKKYSTALANNDSQYFGMVG